MVRRTTNLIVLRYCRVMLFLKWRYCEVSYRLYFIIILLFFDFRAVYNVIRTPSWKSLISRHSISLISLFLSSPLTKIFFPSLPNINIFLNSLIFLPSITKIKITCNNTDINFLINFLNLFNLINSFLRIVQTL